jgi:hypothetical protein
MIFKETKFAYRHNPTGKWVYLDIFLYNNEFSSGLDKKILMHFVDEFCPEIVHCKNTITEDLIRSTIHGEKYASQNFLEFELVEIEIEYKVKS